MPAIIEPQGPPGPDDPSPSLISRLIWFAGLAIVAAAATGLVAEGLRLLILPRH
jgi:hypothetical protein